LLHWRAWPHFGGEFGPVEQRDQRLAEVFGVVFRMPLLDAFNRDATCVVTHLKRERGAIFVLAWRGRDEVDVRAQPDSCRVLAFEGSIRAAG
jgi:hypothetical protein